MDNASTVKPLFKPRIEKVVVNCSIGEGGAKLEKAQKIIESITGQKPEIRKAKKTIRGFGIHRGEPIAIRVTLRKQAAEDFLRKALAAVNNKIKRSSIDTNGNVSFGIKEHLDIPGTRYNPELGIVGMDVTVHLSKPGYRVAKRAYRPSKIGSKQRVSSEETIEFLRSFGVEVIEE
ncbi:MAG: 50S ribosomal protein L5 [Candidatus Caldarchaeum sp.]|nr:50S ribosomal protein L5 [Candidatus Caldarchaeum sp.]